MKRAEEEEDNQVILFKLDKLSEQLVQLSGPKLKLDLLNQIPDSSLIFTDGEYFTFYSNSFFFFLNFC